MPSAANLFGQKRSKAKSSTVDESFVVVPSPSSRASGKLVKDHKVAADEDKKAKKASNQRADSPVSCRCFVNVAGGECW